MPKTLAHWPRGNFSFIKWNMFQTSGILAISYKFVFLCQWRNILVQTVLSCLPYSKPLLTIYKALLHHIQSSLFNISTPPSFYHIQSPLFTTYRAHSSQIWRSSLPYPELPLYHIQSPFTSIFRAHSYHIQSLSLPYIQTTPSSHSHSSSPYPEFPLYHIWSFFPYPKLSPYDIQTPLFQ